MTNYLILAICSLMAVGCSGSSCKGYAGHAYVDSCKAALMVAEAGDGYFDGQDAGRAAPLIDHLTGKDAEETDGSPVSAAVASNDPDKDFCEDDDYWYYKDEDGTITGVPKPKNA